mmetsp:Transcript_65168/g.121484  ORF Transcript_65168/g.121484 Transcript_65168/m.121484 type:complete len:217 (-) Transcript_65168:4-654(-)
MGQMQCCCEEESSGAKMPGCSAEETTADPSRPSRTPEVILLSEAVSSESNSGPKEEKQRLPMTAGLEAWPEDNVEYIGTAPSIPKSVKTESVCPELELEITLTREDTTQRLGLDVKHLGTLLEVHDIFLDGFVAYHNRVVTEKGKDEDAIKLRDRIIKVNEVSGNDDQMIQEAWTSRIMNLTIVRSAAAQSALSLQSEKSEKQLESEQEKEQGASG